MHEADWTVLQHLKDRLDFQEGRTLLRLAEARLAGACSAELIASLGRWLDALISVHLVLSRNRWSSTETDRMNVQRGSHR